MRVLVLQNMLYLPVLGGANKALRRLLSGLTARGHVCRAVVPAVAAYGVRTRDDFLAELRARSIDVRAASAEMHDLRIEGVEVHAYADPSRMHESVAKEVGDFGPDVVVVAAEDPGQVLLEAALATAKAPVVYVAQTTWNLPFGPASLHPTARGTSLLGRCANVIVHSEYLARTIREGGVRATRVPFLQLALDPPREPAGRPSDDGSVTLVNPCAIKGIGIFLELARQCPTIRFAAVPTWGTTDADLAALEGLPNIALWERTERIEELYSRTRVLLVPSLWDEAFGLVAVEAMLRGIPVLAADVGGLPEAMLGVDYLLPVRRIERYGPAFDARRLPIPVVPEQDVRPWVEALTRVWTDPARYAELSARGRAAATAWLENRSIEPFEDALRSVAAARDSNAKTSPAVAAGGDDARAQPGPERDLQEKIAGLSPERRALLARRLKKRTRTEGQARAGIPRRTVASPCPASFAQQRLWFLDQLEPGGTAYNLMTALELRGPLDVGATEKAVRELVRRHEVLRTTFVEVDGVPLQLIHDGPSVALRQEDVDENGLADAVRHESERPFDLRTGPLARFKLLRIGPTRHVLVMTLHHIVTDAWSAGVMFRELAALYEAFARGKPSPLPELPIQYADFAVWQRSWLEGGELDRQLSYWREQLDGVTTLELPTDRPRPAIRTTHGKIHGFSIDGPVIARLGEIARQQGATLFMALLSLFGVVLSRYSGQTDICIGTTLVNRAREELEALIGFFVNTLVLRVPVLPRETYLELLGRAKDTTLRASANQDVPFDRVVEELVRERDLSRTPLFQVMCTLQNAPLTAIAVSELTVERIPFDEESAKFDLMLRMSEEADRVAAFFDFNADLFDRAAIERMADQFRVLCADASMHPDWPIERLSLVGDAEREQLLVAWNGATEAERAPRTLHRLFTAQVERSPDAVALELGEERVTYRELHARALRVADALAARSVGPERLVALHLERSTELIAAILGVLLAGGAYVPIDPAYPPERIRFIVEDARALCVVTRRALGHVLSGDAIEQLFVEDLARDGAEPAGRARAEAQPFHLAYAIYTSGTTGRPKGVLVEHAAAARTVATLARFYDVSSESRVLQFASIGFDASVEEIFKALSVGARLVLLPKEEMLPGRDLSRSLRERAVTNGTFTPSALGVMDPEDSPSLRTVVTAGEACPPDTARTWSARTRLLNAYGPTEGTICATVATCKPDDAKVSIGRAIDGKRVYVLDPSGALAGVGVPGELAIGGEGLARGYLGRPALTAERFTPDPFASTPGARLYRTGDRARYRSDGNLEYLGRFDQQVKLRGFRIELAEIEACMEEHPDVARAVVVVRDDGPGDGRLCLYAVPREASAADPEELREFLRRTLPEYMIPAAVLVLEELPLTANGKVDRAALPSPDAPAAPTGAYGAPRGPVEESLVSIWTEVLRAPRVGIHDDFFDLGGHSLLATQVVARIRSAFGVELGVREIFEAPTVAELADRIRLETQQEDETPGIAPAPRDRPLPLSYSQERLWFLDHLHPESSAYNIAGAVRMNGELDVAALRASLGALVQRHESLRTTFASSHGVAHQVIHEELAIPLEVTPLDGLGERAREEVLASELQREFETPFALARGPLLRTRLFRFGEREHVFAFTMHHIIADGWSIGILVRELGALYAAFARGLPSPLAPLGIQVADFAVWQRTWLDAGELERQLTYWRTQLAGVANLDLPTDRPRPAVHGTRGAGLDFRLPAPLAADLGAFARRQGGTLYMVLAAGFALLLARYARQRDVAIGTPIANRTRSELEGLIGFFVNTLVLRVDVAEELTAAALFDQVKKTTLEAYAHQDVPFERLVDELAPQRDMSRTPLFQVLFVLQNAPIDPIALPDLTISPETIESRTAKFDLTLAMEEGEDGIYGHFELNTDLFDAATIARMAGHLRGLLADVAERPEAPIGALSLLTDAERHQLLVEWNDARSGETEPSTLHGLFEARVAQGPGNVALVFEDATLTYGELNASANAMAHRLRALGVGPDVLVGICLDRTADMVVSLLAVLKAGGAYVPLDPRYPEERLTFIVDDAHVAVVVTHSALEGRFEARAARTLLVDRTPEGDVPATNPASGATSSSLAYVIYTSGSTGKPKGALIPHGNVTRLFAATDAPFGFGSDDVWSLFHSFAFDFSVWELWGALLYGGKVVVVPYDVTRSPHAFYELLVRERVTVLSQTPTAFRQLMTVDAEAERRRLALRYVIFGGEALDIPSLRPWFDKHGYDRPKLVNMYGITETTVHVTIRPLGPSDLLGKVSTVGRAIADMTLYVLDPELSPAPLGVPGEMYVGSAGLARGYLNRPALTAERFVPDPFGPTPGGRLYRSGDLARYASDGSIIYLGRIDHQVKIRGFRIELAEIELHLQEHPSVGNVVVLAREDLPGDKRLVAYVTRTPAAPEPTAAELREHLIARLPEYMVPAAFVFLEALPMTSHGKVDKKALPIPEASRAAGAGYVAPSTDRERTLSEIWSQVLRLDRVGIDDDFFAVGGDSILSLQIIARAREAGLELTVKQLFENPTVRTLAAAAATASASRERSAPFALLRAEDRAHLPDDVVDAYPLARLQLGMLFHGEYDAAGGVYHDVFSHTIELDEALDETALRSALTHLGRCHPMLRASFDLTRYTEPLHLIHAEPAIPVEVFDLRETSAPEQERILVAWLDEERKSAFDWARGPLFRLFLHHLGARKVAFTLSFHHAILDGWSVATFLSELFRQYAVERGKGGEPVTAPAASYREFVALERRACDSEETRRFWSAYLEGASPIRLPRAGVREEEEAQGAPRLVFMAFTEELDAGLKALARLARVPIKSVLLSAHLRVLCLLAGQHDVMTGMVTHGRSDDLDGDRVLGLYLNTLPLRQRVEGGSWEDLVRATFANEQRMLPHRRYPLADIQRTQGQALFEVFFNFVHFHVYKSVEEAGGMEEAGGHAFEATNFALMAGFSMSLDEKVSLTLLATDPDLSERQLRQFLGYYTRTLEAMAFDPDGRIEGCALLSTEERHQLSSEWNAPIETDARALHRLFEAEAARKSDAVALVFEGETLTYGELNARANRLAHRLRRLGVGPETAVGVCLERSFELVVAILGALKAGGAFVPLMPDYPAERRRSIVEQSGTRVLVTRSTHAGVDAGIPSVRLDEADLSSEPEHELELASSPSALAYVLFTSGSTGAPKGAMNTHGAIVNRLLWARRYAELSPRDVILHKTPISFDVSIPELFLPLMTGARMVIARPDGHRDPDYLVDLVRAEAVTWCHFVPAMLGPFLDAFERGAKDTPAALRVVVCSGEALPGPLASRASRVLRARVDNLYGPTEAAVDVSVRTLAPEDEGAIAVPLGRAIDGARLYVLDEGFDLVPLGVAAELFLAGLPVGRGYAARPDLTAERFLPDPYGEPGARMYRTGDLVRRRDDGVIEFLGRLDFQVKLRGFRIELGEIEARLRSHGSVAGAVVLLREDRAGDGRLVAYVVAREAARVDLDELRAFVAASVPDYMVPSSFVLLDAFPLTTSGKIDRKAFPAPDVEDLLGSVHAPPRSPIEESLASIWSEVLGVPRIGIHDNFFALGGHSLSATQVVSRVRAALGAEVPLRTLFEAPTIAGLAASLESKTDRGAPPLVPAPSGSAKPLSYAQERVWFLEQLDPGNVAYNMPGAVRLLGDLDVDALRGAIDDLVRRHDSLRTTFHEENGVAKQVVSADLRPSFAVDDLTPTPPDARDAALRRAIEEEGTTPFDLARGPLLRARLLRFSPSEHVLVYGMHHIVSDGWSMGVLVAEINALYAARREHRPAALAPLPIQYSDFAVWQRSWLEAGELLRQLTYWKEQLAGAATLELPTDRPRPAVQTTAGRSHVFLLPASLAQALRGLARRHGATLYMVLLAGLNAVLARYAGQSDVSVGTPIANRTRSELESLIGFFVNTLVLRSQVDLEGTFGELLGGVRSTTLDAYAHQDVPFERLVDELSPKRDLSRSALFQVMFSLQNAPARALEIPGLTLAPVAFEAQIARFDLTVTMTEDDGGIVAAIDYNTDLFDRTTIVRMASHVRGVLEQAVRGPDAKLIDAAACSDTERQQLLVEWNDTDMDVSASAMLPALFERQVERTPNAPALVFEDKVLTYAELDALANQLAHRLRAQGVGTDVLVGVCMERSVELVTSLLAVLKAGGAYVPLDPDYPAERLTFMLESASPRVLLAQPSLAPRLAASSAPVSIVDASEAWTEPRTPPPVTIHPESLAYLLFTSGSTGRPKGAMNTHGALANHMRWMVDRFPIPAGGAVLQKTTFGFDASVWEFWAPLLSGARLVVAKPGGQHDIRYLIDLVVRDGVTTLQLVPSLLQVMVDEGAFAVMKTLRQVYVGGEALGAELASRFAAQSNAPLVNLYGPTEAAIQTIVWRCDPDAAAAMVPIGRPIWNTRAHVLDRDMRAVPLGVLGELYLGGVPVGRGYWGRPDLTAERFLPDPYGASKGARLYRTGDVVRRRADGVLEYVGRSDHQVKLRGFRIEIGEIETRLGQHPKVGSAVVVVREDGKAGRQLVAYVVLVEEGASSPSITGELRSFLSESLPGYMVPWTFVVLDELPLSPNGKVDRRALPPPDAGSRLDPDREPSLPRNEKERILAEVWAEVLGLGEVGVNDNFFELGGDSILSIQVVSRAAARGLRVTPKQIFQAQTVAELAALAEEGARVVGEQGIVTGAVPFTPILRWFFDRGLDEPHHYNQAALLEVPSGLDLDRLEKAFQAIVRHHDALRLRFQSKAASWEAEIADVSSGSAVVVRDLSDVPDDAVASAVERAASELQASVDLSSGLLLRVGYFELGPRRRGRLFIGVHHAAIDGVSWRILLEDLARVSARLEGGQTVDLAPKTTSFKAWAERLVAYASSPRLAKEAAFWLGRPWERARPLPVAERVASTTTSARTFRAALTEDETEALLRDTLPAYRLQVNDVLLTALARAFAAWTSQRTLLVDLEGHGREDLFDDVDLSRTVGWFTTLFPVLLELPEGDSAGAALKAVKEQLRAIPDRGIGFGVLKYLDDGDAGRRLRDLPSAEVVFNYLGQFDRLGEQERYTLAAEPSGPPVSPRAPRSHLIEINAMVIGGALRIDWTYEPRATTGAVVEKLAADFVDALRELIAHCRSDDAEGFTPSDFPLVRPPISQSALDAIAETQGGARAIEDVYGLSPLQQGLLFHGLSSPGDDAYFNQLTCHLPADTDLDALVRALHGLVDRHPIFRSSFVWQGLERPVQIVHRSVRLPVQRHDWRGLSDEASSEKLATFLRQDRARGFVFETAPLMRVAFLRTSNGHRFVWSFHHILADGWSMPIVFEELFALYEAARAKRAPPILPARRPYRDYIEWLADQDRDAAEAFWKDALEGFLSPTSFAPSPPASASASAIEETRHLLSRDTTQAVMAFARSLRVTLNTVVQGAWALLLGAYSGASDVVFGGTVSGRTAPLAGIESMVGLFINTVPVRIRLDARTDVATWLRALQTRQAEARHYEHTPLADVQGWSALPRGTALFDSLVVFENYPVETSLAPEEGEGIAIADVHFVENTNYSLTLAVGPGEELLFRLGYDTSRFDAAWARELVARLEHVLIELARTSSRALGEVSLLDEAARRQFLVDWNETPPLASEEASLAELVASQAARAPDARAVTLGSESLSYRELDERANHLAHDLVAAGAGPDVLVGICLERSFDLVVALLAVLKAGGAYVPIDPTYPADRIAFMLEDSRPRIVLCHDRWRGLLGRYAGAVRCLDADAPGTRADPPPLPSRLGSAGGYVIYTSGSTGKPKGVVVPERGIKNYVLAMQATYPMTPDDALLQLASYSFDISFWEIFAPLVVGARVVLVPPDRQKDPAFLGELLEREQISLVHFVPSLLSVLSEQLRRAPFLRRIYCGGEALVPALAQATLSALPGAELVHQYGPTETAIVCCTHACLPALGAGERLPIGRSLPNTRAYVVDRELRPLPSGARGELLVGGVGVARGYLGRPELTAERFVPDPFSAEPGARLYRTGDLARRLRSGDLEFFGRVDHQIKLRGMRVELGEIEARLAEHAAVDAVAVMLREDRPGEARLVAYLVFRAGASPEVAELRAFAARSLPEHMIPAAFLAMDALPLGPTGKVDRRALPLPDDEQRLGPSAEFAEPRNERERILAEVWASVLGVSRVGVHDNFFELGGDSILSIQVVSRAAARGVRITPKDVFQSQTVAELANVVGEASAFLEEQGLVTGPVPLTPILADFFEQHLNEPHHFNQTLLFETPSGVDVRHLEQAFQALVSHHDALRLRFHEEDGVWRTEIAEASASPLVTVRDLSTVADGDVPRAIEREATELQTSLDLSGSLVRAGYFELGEPRGGRLFVVIHHLAVDGVSWRILLEDLGATMQGLRQGAPPALPPKTTSFKRWAERLVEYASSPELLREADYWLSRPWDRVAGLPLEARVTPTVGEAATVSGALSAEETESLLRDAFQGQRLQANEVLLAALASTFAAATDGAPLLVDLEGHGREDIFDGVDLSRTVGWFTTVFPVVFEISGSMTPGEVLRAVKGVLREIPNKGLGFGVLKHLERGEIGERLRSLPAADVVFNYLGQFDSVGQGEDAYRPAAEPTGPSVSANAVRTHVIDVSAIVAGGELSVTWTFDRRAIGPGTVERLARGYLDALKDLIDYCRSGEGEELSPEDFPDADLDQAALDAILDSLE